MKTMLRLRWLDALAAGVALFGRYGGGVGAWVDVLSTPVLDVTRAHVRRTAAVESCARALSSVPADERGQLALEALARVGALDGLRASELADFAMLATQLQLAGVSGVAGELAAAARVVA